ncbi:MAG: YdcF family protein [Beijerinckiaceae bacterium]|nr:YdcF family protein [Beijerinckiaceae bacterium]
MFFTISKIFWLVAEPVSFAILAGVLGFLLGSTRFARLGRILMAGAIVLLAACLLTPLGALLLRPLEDRFPQPPVKIPEPAGIIVLGGAVDTVRSEARGRLHLNSDAARMTAGVELARRYPSALLVYTGGAAALLGESRPEAKSARELWLSLGVPSERMTFEDMSRNTWENAIFTRDLLKPGQGGKWLLVTSAWHMPRSVGIFRRAGFDVIPYPVAYRTFGDGRDYLPAPSMSERVGMLDCSIREWIGLLAYWLTGKSDALFPAP